MPIDGKQDLDPNSLDYGLPLDTCCVGSPDPDIHRAYAGGPVGKSPVQIVGGKIPVGYDGPLGNTGDQHV